MRRRGQSTLELAMILPFFLGLLLLILQVGLLVSDQVKLEHFAYEGAQWAIANPTTATADPAGAPGTGTIAQHIYGLMCGGAGSTPPSGAGTRFCKAQPSGVPALNIKVVSQGTPTSMAPRVAPTGQVLAGSQCKAYSLSVSPSSFTVYQSGAPTSATFTITDTSMGGQGPDPAVNLNVSGFPPGLQVPPIFVPSQIEAGQTAVTTLTAGASTPPGTYTLSFDGNDTCTSATSSTGPAVARLTVVGTSASPSPSASPNATVGITGILPGLICVNVTSPITINGFGFQAGATVTTGPLSALSVSVVSSTQININTAALAAGSYNMKVTNPDGTFASLTSAISVSATCGGGCFASPGGTPGPTTVTDLTATWTLNQWVGGLVTMGASTATVLGNTATALTFSAWAGGVPTPGAYDVCPPAPVGGATPTPSPSGCCFSGTVGTPGPTTLTDLTASWTPNQWVGATVTMGGSTATVTSNSGTVLTFSGWTGGTPPPGAYTIQLTGGGGGGGATSSCAGTGGQYQTMITITWYEPLVIPLFAPSGTPFFTLRAVQFAFCQ